MKATFSYESHFSHAGGHGEKINDAKVRIWYDSPYSALAKDTFLTFLIKETMVIHVNWVINIFNGTNIREQVRKYNTWREEGLKNIFVSQEIKDKLSSKKPISEWPTDNQFSTWLASEVAPIYFHIINRHHSFDQKEAQEIVIDLLQSYYIDHDKISELTQETLDKAIKRAYTID